MNVLGMISRLFTIVLVMGVGTWVVEMHQVPIASAQGDTGVFGGTEKSWDESIGPSQGSAGDYTEYELDDGTLVYVGFDNDGRAYHVEYVVDAALSRTDAESFAESSLLPGDAKPLGEYERILGSDGGERISITLYFSESVTQEMTEYSGIIVFAFRDDGANFSVSLG